MPDHIICNLLINRFYQNREKCQIFYTNYKSQKNRVSFFTNQLKTASNIPF